MDIERRKFIAGLGGVAIAAPLLAACAKDSDDKDKEDKADKDDKDDKDKTGKTVVMNLSRKRSVD